MSLIFKSHGKLLITGEYFVLKGAQSLCIPTKFFQTLKIKDSKEKNLVWKSFDHNNEIWIDTKFSIPDLEILKSKNKQTVFLQNLLLNAKKLNRSFLKSNHGFRIESKMNFDKNWGLGSSSTLINNISSWAKINPYDLLWSTSKGSGYDIASGQSKGPLLYKLVNKKPVYELVDFKPKFHEQLFFVYMNKKQQTDKEIIYFNNNIKNDKNIVDTISSISQKLIDSENFENFKSLILEHEKILSTQLKKRMVKEIYFSDYSGEIKSLGAWGGDFILAAGPSDTKKYFEEKGYKTIFSFKDMLKNA